MSYAQQSDVEAIFGPANVAGWSVYEASGATPDGPANPYRVAAALDYADAEVNAFFAGGPYAVPLSVASAARPTVAYWAAVIAGCWLSGCRAAASYVDFAGDRYLAVKAAVYADMQLYKAGVKRLDAARRTQPTAPTPT